MFWQNINKVIMGGNICNDLSLREIKGKTDTKVIDFSIANNLKSSEGSSSKANFYRCEAWGKTAENICNFFKKGDPITVEGTLHYSKWTDKETNSEREMVKIRVESFFFPPTRRAANRTDEQEPRVPGNFPPPLPSNAAPLFYGAPVAGSKEEDDDIPL